MSETLTGGCQCGAVRYRIDGPLTNAHICHCRMCQKAAGNYFMPLGNVQCADFTVNRGAISWFESSRLARRGFCRDCGTPLAYDGLQSPHLNITLGSLDDPALAPPEKQLGVESKAPFFACLDGLPSESTEEGFAPADLDEIASSRRTHPDHETADWPAGDES